MTPASEYKHVQSIPRVLRRRLPSPPLGYVFAAQGRPWGKLLDRNGHGLIREVWRNVEALQKRK